MADRPGYEDVPLLQLMRDAREVYRQAIGGAAESVGCDDIPRNGMFVLAGLDHDKPETAFSPQADVVASLGLSRQMASQLIDTLVVRNYLERRNDPVDRRRMEVRLTPRGRTAAIAVQGAIDAIESTVADQISTQDLRGLRIGLAAYRAVRARSAGVSGDSSPHTTRSAGSAQG